MKVGIVTETPYLPVSKSVKRAMGITRKALEAAGYEVVDINVDPKDYAEGRNLSIEMVINLYLKHIFRSIDKSGERLDEGNANSKFLLERGPFGRWCLDKIMLLTGKHRERELVKNILFFKNTD